MTIECSLSFLTQLILAGAIAGVGLYLKSYILKKAENSATKEDIRELTGRVEAIKHEFATRLHVRQVRYEREYDLLVDIWEKVVALRDATVRLRPESDTIQEGVSDSERKAQRVKIYMAAGREFYLAYENRKPFFPEPLYTQLSTLIKRTWRETVQYKHGDPNKQPEYWDQAVKNLTEVDESCAAIEQFIRERARRWEMDE